VLPTSTYRASDFLEAAAEAGVEVAVAAEAPLPLIPEDRFVLIDCSRPEHAAEEIADFLARTPVDAIVPVDDAGVVVAALAADRMGMAHNPPEAVAATRNKVQMRRLLDRSEVPQPTFRLLGQSDDPSEVAEQVGYPLVVKPLGLSGSRGVIKVTSPSDLEQTVERVRLINITSGSSPSEPLLMEAFMPGPEVAVEGLVWNGRLEVLAVFDKPEALDGPYFEETIMVAPSTLHPEMLEEVERVAGLAVSAIGIANGPVHAELRITDGRVGVLEVAARSIGGLCGRTLRFGLSGDSLESLIIEQALGKPQDGRRLLGSTGVLMIPIPAGGRLAGVDGIGEVSALPHVTGVEITVPVGSRIRPVPEADRYLGFVFARAPDPKTVTDTLLAAKRMLVVLIEPPTTSAPSA
jgi:biotin carboxylase